MVRTFLHAGVETVIAVAVALFLCPTPGQAEVSSPPDAYFGNYRTGPDHWFGIDRFVDDSGKTIALFSDYQSGVVRPLHPVSATEFVMGPDFESKSPIALTVEFRKDGHGAVTGMSLRPPRGEPSFAMRAPLREEPGTFRDGDATLAGTLMTPATPGPHPAIVLLHGSGPLTRWSFGPYPHFFTSLGFSVLVYDKRGTGQSTGTLLDASTIFSGPSPTTREKYYPDDLVNDALAALHYLGTRNDIDPRRIGFWGSSEGGMLTTQVAARSKDVAFIIDSSGSMVPLSQTVRYQEILRQKEHLSREDLDRAVALTDMWMRVAMTGKGWDEFVRTRDEGVKGNKPWVSLTSRVFASEDHLRWVGGHILAVDPRPALARITCPVLAVYGEKDALVDAAAVTHDLRPAFAASKDVTIKVFPGAGHSLMEMPAQSRMAPGVFETLRAWLRSHAGDQPDALSVPAQ